MSRKILQAGPTTLAVSLPMSWVKRFDLKKGQELRVEEQGKCLKVQTGNSRSEDMARIDVDQYKNLSARLIGNLYKAGYSRITASYVQGKMINFQGVGQKELDVVRNMFDQLIGMQLWEIGSDKISSYATAVETAKLDSKEFDNVFNKMNLHLVQQAEQVYTALVKGKDIFDEARLAERLINQTADFCIRVLILFGYEDFKKTIPYYHSVSKLESIGDKYFKIALQSKKYGLIPSKEDLKYLKKTSSFLREIASLYRKFDRKKLTKLSSDLVALSRGYDKDIANRTIEPSLISCNIYSIFEELYELVEAMFFLNHASFQQ